MTETIITNASKLSDMTDRIFTIPLNVITLGLIDNSSDTGESRRRLYTNPLDVPLYRGFGTHYAFIWVGSPPQVYGPIIDLIYILHLLNILCRKTTFSE